MSRVEFNCIINDPNFTREQLFSLGRSMFDGEKFKILPADIDLPTILVKLGIFQSKTQARKNGWGKPLEHGLHRFTIGKLKHKIWLFKPYKVEIE